MNNTATDSNAEVIEVEFNNTITVTTDMNKVQDILSSRDRLKNSWQAALRIIKEFGVAVEINESVDYSKINLFADRGAHIFSNAQCRKELDMERVENYQERFDKGEPKKLPTIAIPIKDENGKLCHVWPFGNTTGEGKRRSQNPIGIYMTVDAEGLPYEVTRELIRQLANVSNVEDEEHAEPDKFEDLPGQVKDAWEHGVLGVDLSSNCPHPSLENNYEWKRSFHKAKSDADRHKIYDEFTKWWIEKHKGKNSKWAVPTIRGKIKAEAFGNKDKGKICGDEWSTEDLATKFNNIFPAAGHAEWDPEVYDIKQSGQDKIWQIMHTWGTIPQNCIRNLKDKILQHTIDHNKWGVFSGVHIIVKGSTGITTMASRKKHIEVVLKDATVFNLLPGRSAGVALMECLIFPQMLRGANVSDYDHAYVWNKGKQCFQEISKKPAGKAKRKTKTIDVLVEIKKCCKCHNELPADAFNKCAPPNSKDGLQPACRDCHKTYPTQHNNKEKGLA